MIIAILFSFIILLTSIRCQEFGCVSRCHMTLMEGNVVPTSYNECICEIVFNDPHQTSIQSGSYEGRLKCTPYYRSLKFRDVDSGSVILHKAVVRVCSGNGMRDYVNQTIFDNEERDYLMQRNFRVVSDNTPNNQDASWLTGFRSTIMQLYRKPDGHLRFG